MNKEILLTDDGLKKLEQELESLKSVKRKEIAEKIKIIDESELKTDAIGVGCKVRVKDMDLDEIVEYQIVGSTEADPMNGKISNESPVGKAFLEHRIGDIVEVEVPDGVISFEVLGISK